MSKTQKIAGLRVISQIKLDAQLGELRKVATARAQTIAHLQDLKVPEARMDETSGVAEVTATLSYQRWADKRRSDLNQTLAQQTALWLDKRDSARLAFGQTDVLRALAARNSALIKKRVPF